jgi:hypothetical protein
MQVSMHFLVFALMVVLYSVSYAGPAIEEGRTIPLNCTYEALVWNVYSKSSGAVRKVSHSYADLAPNELDPVTGCTVCSEDQVRISIPPLQPFSLCYKLAPRMRSVIETMMRGSAPIHTVDGYRVVRSRGPIDESGNRTEFSNHSFGTAIDINPEQNGLYDNCIRFSPDCRLVRGGQWLPGMPGTLEKDSAIVTALRSAGFLWGGEIAGKQKDFMHFSLTGY